MVFALSRCSRKVHHMKVATLTFAFVALVASFGTSLDTFAFTYVEDQPLFTHITFIFLHFSTVHGVGFAAVRDAFGDCLILRNRQAGFICIMVIPTSSTDGISGIAFCVVYKTVFHISFDTFLFIFVEVVTIVTKIANSLFLGLSFEHAVRNGDWLICTEGVGSTVRGAKVNHFLLLVETIATGSRTVAHDAILGAV